MADDSTTDSAIDVSQLFGQLYQLFTTIAPAEEINLASQLEELQKATYFASLNEREQELYEIRYFGDRPAKEEYNTILPSTPALKRRMTVISECLVQLNVLLRTAKPEIDELLKSTLTLVPAGAGLANYGLRPGCAPLLY